MYRRSTRRKKFQRKPGSFPNPQFRNTLMSVTGKVPTGEDALLNALHQQDSFVSLPESSWEPDCLVGRLFCYIVSLFCICTGISLHQP
jgi:hypothetical protein